MKRFSIAAMGFAVVFFFGGVGWGFWLTRQKQQEMAHNAPLRLLCPENWLATGVLETFSRDHNVRIEEFTYSHPNDFLRQIANADGKVDVICTSSLLVRSLVRSHWLKKMDFASLPNRKEIAVDFDRLPYDPNSEYTAPLFWNLYGFFGKGDMPKALTWKHTWQSKRLSLWGEELNVLNMMDRLELSAGERVLEEQRSEVIDDEFKKFAKDSIRFLKPNANPASTDALMGGAEWVLLPLARVAKALGQDSQYRFWLPDDGATMEVGVLAVGEKSTQPELALSLINELISTSHALQVHNRLDTGVVHRSLNTMPSILTLNKPEALRKFPLNRLRFPDVNIEELPPFQKVFDESTVSEE